MSIKSNFEQNITNQLERLKEIISSPHKLNAHLQNVYKIHEAIEKDIENYNKLSSEQIRKDVYELCLPMLEKYRSKSQVQADVKTHTIKQKHDIGNLNFDTYNLEFVDSSIYDELFQNVDITMDKTKLTTENKKMIRKYMKLKEEIENEYESLILDIKRYEQNMVNLRQKLLDKCSNDIIPKLYNAHLSHVKQSSQNRKNKVVSDEPIYVDINNIQYPIKQKQTEFIPAMIKKYLQIE